MYVVFRIRTRRILFFIFFFLFNLQFLLYGLFFAFLSVPDHDKDRKTSLQHCKQIFSIWKDLQRKGIVSLEDLLDADHIKQEWLSKFMAVWSPGTYSYMFFRFHIILIAYQ